MNKTRTTRCVRSHHVMPHCGLPLTFLQSIDEVRVFALIWTSLLIILSPTPPRLFRRIVREQESVAAGHPVMLMFFNDREITHVPINCSMEGRIPAVKGSEVSFSHLCSWWHFHLANNTKSTGGNTVCVPGVCVYLVQADRESVEPQLASSWTASVPSAGQKWEF